jgi:hypothetical protein
MCWYLLHTSSVGDVQKAHAKGKAISNTFGHARANRLQISLIEDLFQVQTNAVRFVNHELYLKTPLLAVIAVFCWLIPIATVYPPGALVVGIQTVPLDTSFNVSVFHAKDLLETGHQSSIAEIMCQYREGTISHVGPPNFPEAAHNTSFLKSCYLTPELVYSTITRIP